MTAISRGSVRVPALLLALLVALAACSSTDAATDADIRVVDPVAAAELLEAEPDRVIIDVRTPAEYAAGHVDGAVLVDYEAADFEERIAEFDRDDDYLIYCRSGNRSAGARQVMADLGFSDVVDVEGGAVAWSGAGLPLVAG